MAFHNIVVVSLHGLLLVIYCSFSGTSAASIDTFHSLNSSDWARIDRMVTTAVQCRNLTGLNIAVINNGNPVYRSYGYADYVNKVPLTPETRTCIASVTKSFTTTLVAILLTENRERYPLKWNTPLRDIFGNDFQLSDTFRTEQATLRDLAAHKIGWSRYNIPSTVGLDESHTRLQYCGRFRYLRARIGFRQRYLYNNEGYMLLGCAVEVMAGEEYETVMRRKLLEPLGMNDTIAFFRIDDWSSKRESRLHMNGPDGVVVIPPELIDTVKMFVPAAGYCSNSQDMVRWMHFQQTFRTAEGEALADDDILSEMHNSQTAVPVSYSFALRPWLPLSDQIAGYGLGWFISSYRGYRTVAHSGMLWASMSNVRFYKDVNLGVVNMANIAGPEVRLAFQLIHSYIADLALGFTPWINESTICSYPIYRPPIPRGMPPALQGFIPRRDLLVCTDRLANAACRSMGTQQTQIPEWTSVYVGQYGHPLWANFTVTFNESTGHLDASNGNSYLGRMVLYPTYNASVFLIRHYYPISPYLLFSDPNRLGSPVVFSSVRDGHYSKLTVPMYGDGVTAEVFLRGLMWDGDHVTTEDRHPLDVIG